MDLHAHTAWWLLAGGLVAAELATGTFYLLMLAVGAAAGALAAHAGMGFAAQMVAAALLGGGGAFVLYRRRAAQGSGPMPQSDPNLNLDIGSRVHVSAWGEDGRAEVHYRGSAWQARWHGEGPPEAGEHVIRALDGSTLVLGRPTA